MKTVFSYVRPVLKVLAFFGCYLFLMGFSAALLVPVLTQIDPAAMNPDEFSAVQSSPAMLLVMQLGSLIGLLITLFIFTRLPPGKDYLQLGITGEKVLKDMGIGLLAGAMLILLSFLAIYLSGSIGSLELNSAFSIQELALWLIIYLIVAFVEELMFRGYFLNVFTERFPPVIAILITALLFGCLHFLNPSFGWPGFLNISLAGILMGLVFYYRGTVWLAVGLHFGWNFVQGTILGFNVSGVEAETIFQLQLSGNELLSGGEFGLEGSLLTTLVCLCAIFLIYYSGRLNLRPIKLDDYESD